jgi:hypothetical protein
MPALTTVACLLPCRKVGRQAGKCASMQTGRPRWITIWPLSSRPTWWELTIETRAKSIVGTVSARMLPSSVRTWGAKSSTHGPKHHKQWLERWENLVHPPNRTGKAEGLSAGSQLFGHSVPMP